MCDCAFPRLTEKCSDFFIRAGKTLQMYNSILKGLKLKKDILATYRKRAIDARFLSLVDNNKNINVGQEEWILQLPVRKALDTKNNIGTLVVSIPSNFLALSFILFVSFNIEVVAVLL